MTEVYNGYLEKFLSGKELKTMFANKLYCDGRHHSVVRGVLIPEYLTGINIENDKEYRIFYNDFFCRVMKPDNDKQLCFFAHHSIDKRLERPVEEQISEKICPTCGAKMEIKTSRFGIFWGCSKYPECKEKETIYIVGNLTPMGFKPCNYPNN